VIRHLAVRWLSPMAAAAGRQALQAPSRAVVVVVCLVLVLD